MPSYLDQKGPGLPSPSGQRAEQHTHRLGERQVMNGHSYELQQRGQRHEWVRVDKDQGSQPQGGAQQPQADPAKAHEFAKTQLGQISGPAKGILSAMHQAGEGATKDFAPEQSGQLYNWLKQNAGQNTGGGAIRELGNGALGFSSPAGAVVVSPGENGKHTVRYTANVGPVTRAMSGDDPFQGHAPPQTPGEQPAQMAGEPPVQNQPTQATPEQMSSASALTEKPKPPAAKNPREAADRARSELETAVNSWQEALAGGLSPQGNNHWKQYVGARKEVWNNLNRIAKEHESRNAPAKPSKDKPPSDMELLAQRRDPEGFSLLQKSRKELGDEFYTEALKHIAEHGTKPVEQTTPAKSTGNAATDFERDNPHLNQPKYEDRPAEVEWESTTTQAERNPPDERSAMDRLGIEPKIDREAGRRGHEANVQAAEAEAAAKTGQPVKPQPKPPEAFETPPVEQPPAQPKPKQAVGKAGSIIRQNAEAWDMSPQDYKSLLRELHPEYTAHHKEREEVKKSLREATGMTAGHINRLENQGGKDSDALGKYDKFISAIAAEYPQHFGEDYLEDAMNLLREGPKKIPGIVSEEFLNHVHDFLKSNAAGAKVAQGEELSAVPFAKRRGDWLYRYEKWLAGADSFELHPVRYEKFDEIQIVETPPEKQTTVFSKMFSAIGATFDHLVGRSPSITVNVPKPDAPQIDVHVAAPPPQPAPIVNVAVQAPQVHVAVPKTVVKVPAPIINVAPPNVTVEAPTINVEIPKPLPPKGVRVIKDSKGKLIGFEPKDD